MADESGHVTARGDISMESLLENDSFATRRDIRTANLLTPSSSQSSASLMHQTLPTPTDMRMEDFSFELGGLDPSPPSRPLTPYIKRPSTPVFREERGKFGTPLVREKTCEFGRPKGIRDAVPGSLFDLYLNDKSERALTIQGTLVPLSDLTLVCPDVPLSIPFVRILDTRSPPSSRCFVSCPSATFLNEQAKPDERVFDTQQATIGTFQWTDERGRRLPSPRPEVIKGDVQVRVQRDSWGLQTMSISIPMPKRGSVSVFSLPRSVPSVKIRRAALGGVSLPRSLTVLEEGVEVRLRSLRKEGMAEATPVHHRNRFHCPDNMYIGRTKQQEGDQ